MQRSAPAFAPGDRIRLKFDPQRRGAVVGTPRAHGDSFEYEVSINGDDAWYSESQLERVDGSIQPRWVRRDELIREVTLAKLRRPLSDALYAYQASRTSFEPYQFRPALKFLRSNSQRLLIADEVGLGKTIEASIIYLELKARLDISRVLVLCPSRLTVKWQDELRNRFEEEFDILDAQKTRQLIADYRRLGDGLAFRRIASYESLRGESLLQELVELNIPLDLLIVDEAHHMRNEETNTHRLGAVLANSADAVVFLTATPLHLGNRDLFNLLTLLAPEDFDNPDLFEEQVRPNEIINRASNLLGAGAIGKAVQELRRVEGTVMRDRFRKNPYYTQLLADLTNLDGRSLTLQDRMRFQWDLMELNTLSSIMTRTRKREVAHGAVRAPFSVRVRFTAEERAFYDAVLVHTREALRRTGSGALGFSTLMRERQAASCLAAFRQQLEEAARKRSRVSLEIDHSEFDLTDGDIDQDVVAEARLVARARDLDRVDSKFDQFLLALEQALAEDRTSKALVFSYFKGTLRYLQKRLRDRGYPVDVIHGDVKVGDRLRAIDQFRSDERKRVLLSSEVGAEGLDFQFCDILINYDLPWNPMQVEQRIGRLDRFGQAHERIRIYNFFIEDTIETRIFQRLYDRIGIFERSIGDLEAILGEEIARISREAVQGRLTLDEQARLAEEAAQRIVRRQRDEAELERHKDELLGQGRILDQRVEQTIRSGRFVSADEVRALVGTFVRDGFPRARMVFDEEEDCATLQFDGALSDHLRKFVEQRKLWPTVTDGLKAAMFDGRRLPVTFDSSLACERPLLEFITARHPLAQAACRYWQEQGFGGVPAGELQIAGPSGEQGDGYFFVYLMTVTGVNESVTLEPIVLLDDGRHATSTSQTVLTALQGQSSNPVGIARRSEDFLEFERRAARIMADKRDEVERSVRMKNEALLAARRASVAASFDAKIRRTRELLDQAADPSIRRMRVGQIENLRTKLAVKIGELERAQQVSVSSALIAGGRIRIV